MKRSDDFVVYVSLSLLFIVSLKQRNYGGCYCSVPDSTHPIGLIQQAALEAAQHELPYTMALFNITYTDPITGQVLTDGKGTGKFGEGHVSAISGVLVHVRSTTNFGTGGAAAGGGGDDPLTACTYPLESCSENGTSSTATISLPNEPWIALVKRGRCNFHVKMENAYYSNATGIIVYNDKDITYLEKMKLQSKVPEKFGAVFTYKSKGEELAKLIDNGTRVTIHISIGETSSSRPPSNINKTSVLFVSISFIVLMIVSLGWIIFYYVQKCRYIHAKERLSKRLCSAAKKALQKIPTRYIRPDEKNGNNIGETDCCAICIELFKPADVVRLLPCRHEFHKLCIDPWLLENRTCPMCKMDILKYFGFELTGSQESMLRVEEEDPFNILFYDAGVPPSPSTVLPITVMNHMMFENGPSSSSSECIGTVVSRAIIDSDAEKNVANVFGITQKSFSKNMVAVDKSSSSNSSLKRSISLDNIPSSSERT